jgi:hypothetical protein
MEKKLCEYCGKEQAYDVFPVCENCLKITMQWGEPAQKQRMKYYFQKKEMENNAEFKARVMEQRKMAQKKYQKSHREQWNAYQREYKKRKAAEAKTLREKVAQLEAQLNAAKQATVAQTKTQTQDNGAKTPQERYFEVGGISYSQAYANMVSGAISSETEKTVDKE